MIHTPKLTALAVAASLLTAACSSSVEDVPTNNTTTTTSGYSINAKIGNLNARMAYLTIFEGGDFMRLDSAVIVDGVFNFEGKVESPEMHFIRFNDGTEGRIDLYLDNNAVSISGTDLEAKNITISGSETHSAFIAFKEEDKVYDDQLIEVIVGFRGAEANGSQEVMDSLDVEYNRIDSARAVFVEDYIEAHTSSAVTSYVLYSNLYRFEDAELETLFGSFSDEVKATKYGKIIGDVIVALDNSKVGKSAPMFTMNDTEGNSVALSDFQGNYVLVDFWASWCGPCREENPNIVEAYNRHKDKGFQILGVSLDDDQGRWLNAIQEDGLVWKHVSDLQGWANEAAKMYAVQSIPHSVLIDKDGVIVAKNLRGDELQAKLDELFATEG